MNRRKDTNKPDTEPLVSVLLPFHNESRTLPQALSSIRRQTFSNFEIICVDDGSDDGSDEVVLHYRKKDPRIIYLRLERSGLVRALNEGLALCRAPFVARMDADDISHPRRLELQLGYMWAHPEVGVVGCLVKAFPKRALKEGLLHYLGWINSLLEPKEICREIFVESPLVHPSVMMRRAVVEEAGGYLPVDGPEDYDLWLRLFERGVPMAKVPQVLYFWRERPQRLTRVDPRYRKSRFWNLKAPYLARQLRLNPLWRGRPVFLWGHRMAGWLARHLIREDIPLEGFININPQKQSSTRLGLPIYPPDILGRFADPLVICAVSTRGARDDIRAICTGLGLREGRDFLMAG
jgi:glycosyltransferase involved in cell wall biosynthesis